MNKSNKLQFSFSSSSQQILNSFNQVKNLKPSASVVDNFLKVTSNPNEKPSEFRSSFSTTLPKRQSKKIAFKELATPLDQPIPSFNADNKQKVAQMKLGNKKVKGILKKNPKYLIPDDIITEQIKKYEQEFTAEKEREGKNLNEIEVSEQEKKKLIESFYFPSSPEKKSNNQEEEIIKTVEDGFKYNLIDYSLKKPDKKNKSNDEMNQNINDIIKPTKYKIFSSVVSNILVDNPFAKLKNKSEEKESPPHNKVPYYQEKLDAEKEAFVIPQMDKTKKNTSESEESGLFDYDKKQSMKRTKLQNYWTFTEEDKKHDEKKKIPAKNDSPHSSPRENKEEDIFVKKPEISRFKEKEIEPIPTPILKEWPEKINYNFSLNISKDNKSLMKAKEDLNNLTTISAKKMDRTVEEPNIETKNQITKLRFFLSGYFLTSDSSRKSELFFTMADKTIIKHDLNRKTWSYHQLDKTLFRLELFAFSSYNNLMIISGGIDPIYGEITKKTYVFNYDDKTLTEKSNMKFSRYKHLMLVLGNVIYCLGGCAKGEIGIKTCEKYLIDEDKWENMASLKVKRSVILGTLSSGNRFLYVLGGNDQENNLILIIEKYDIANDLWGLINVSNELEITSSSKVLLLNKKSYSDKLLDDIIILDKKNGENGPEFKSSLIDLQNGVVEEDLEFRLNPENYIILHQDSFFVFPFDTFEKSDKLSLKTSMVENVGFDFCL